MINISHWNLFHLLCFIPALSFLAMCVVITIETLHLKPVDFADDTNDNNIKRGLTPCAHGLQVDSHIALVPSPVPVSSTVPDPSRAVLTDPFGGAGLDLPSYFSFRDDYNRFLDDAFGPGDAL